MQQNPGNVVQFKRKSKNTSPNKKPVSSVSWKNWSCIFPFRPLQVTYAHLVTSTKIAFPSNPLETCGWSLNQNQQQGKQTDKIFPHLGRLFILPGFSCCLQRGVGNGNNRQQQKRGRGRAFHQTSVISSSTSSPSVSPSASPSSSSSSSEVTSSSSVWETHLTQEHTNR